MSIFIKEINISKLRHLENIDIILSENIKRNLIITGKNGVGKTTVLKAIKQYLKSIEEKNALIEALRNKNYNMLNNNENVDVFNGTASFISNTEILINSEKEDIILEG